MLQEITIDRTQFVPKYSENIEQSQYGKYTDKKVTLQNGTKAYVLRAKGISKLCYYLHAKRREFNQLIRDKGSVEANNFLQSLWKKDGFDYYKLLIDENNRVLRITSIDYIGVPHTELQGFIEERLTAEGIKFEKKTTHYGSTGFYKMLGMKQIVQGVIPVIHYFNKNSGDRSIKFNGGGMVLVCSNGMMTEKSSVKVRIPHRMELEKIKKRVNDIIGKVLENIENMPVEFERLKKLKISKEDAKKKVDELTNIAGYLREAIKRQIDIEFKNETGTYWDLYMATTFVGSNMTQVPRGKKKVRMHELTEEQTRTLQSIELLTPLIQVKSK